jgi:hypothetical protein
MKKIFLSTILLSIAFVACKPKEKAKDLILKEGKWKITKLALTNSGGSQDLYKAMSDCDKDNYYFFNADNSFSLDESTLKCNASDPQTTTDGKWALEQNNTQLVLRESTIFGVKSDEKLNVVSITSTSIEFSKDTVITLPDPFGTVSGKFQGTFSNLK